MGLTLEFYQGDVHALTAVFTNGDYEALDDANVVKRSADLSLHITPYDLDSLSLQVGRFTGAEPMELSPSLEALVDEEDRGLLSVSPTWVAYFAALPPSRVDALVAAWFEAMQKEYADTGIAVTPEAIQGVNDLVALCSAAQQSGGPVLHSWML